MNRTFRPTEEVALRNVRIELLPIPAKKRWLQILMDAVDARIDKDAQNVRNIEYADNVRKNVSGHKIEWSDK